LRGSHDLSREGNQEISAQGNALLLSPADRRRIEAEYGTEAFVAEVLRLNSTPRKEPPEASDGTLGGLIRAYRASPEFLGLADRTKRDYQRVLDYLRPMGDLALSRLTSKGVLDARDKAFKKHKRRFANYLVQMVSLLCLG
jgi:hypothetical protein